MIFGKYIILQLKISQKGKNKRQIILTLESGNFNYRITCELEEQNVGCHVVMHSILIIALKC